MNTPITLTIAGSDSGGGAGIQADIKAISATGGYACSVITALTAQNTQGVFGIHPVPADFIAQQLDVVFADLPVRAVKVGMLAKREIIGVVAQKLRQYRPEWVVLDPVMVATSGDLLLAGDAMDSLLTELLPLADVITPNLAEASRLLDLPVPGCEAQMNPLLEASRQLISVDSALGRPQAMLLKGGHLHNEAASRDFLIQAAGTVSFSAPRLATRNTHGTGCTLSAAIASYLAQGVPLEQACRQAKDYLTRALQSADRWQIGQGHGPVDHFFALHE
ncbi:MAG: bifunctional hydroxymethylpyrimidine kinase/phosphomethylpyrimidine kinase [Shewanella sp.]|nr:bifunctional hydroxymethylpyrimidine kinase/phosphomethylpyrimidine kinase [Shewanella sp.]MCF1439743.1 bifunctional hydroxymethylpyrimidine kinase/phosphomethylpyrimidine kinase [Shewanella sp.]MCF1456189.1 bifunctional hydroxymethylpyrimidine kinase/phosphomethylpyrimidine kinase [Shewanella sp.]